MVTHHRCCFTGYMPRIHRLRHLRLDEGTWRRKKPTSSRKRASSSTASAAGTRYNHSSFLITSCKENINKIYLNYGQNCIMQEANMARKRIVKLYPNEYYDKDVFSIFIIKHNKTACSHQGTLKDISTIHNMSGYIGFLTNWQQNSNVSF